MLRRSLLFALAAVCFTASTAYATSITVSTDQQGANTTIDQAHWFVWTFSVTSSSTVDDILGSFEIKRGTNTSEPIVFSLFDEDVSDNTVWTLPTIMAATPEAFFSKPALDVDTSFGVEGFLLGPGLNLTDSVATYSLVLWSNTATPGGFQFFFKGENNGLVVKPCGIIGGSDISCPVIDDQAFGEAPEPSTVILTLSGLAFIAVRRWRR